MFIGGVFENFFRAPVGAQCFRLLIPLLTELLSL